LAGAAGIAGVAGAASVAGVAGAAESVAGAAGVASGAGVTGAGIAAGAAGAGAGAGSSFFEQAASVTASKAATNRDLIMRFSLEMTSSGKWRAKLLSGFNNNALGLTLRVRRWFTTDPPKFRIQIRRAKQKAEKHNKTTFHRSPVLASHHGLTTHAVQVPAGNWPTDLTRETQSPSPLQRNFIAT